MREQIWSGVALLMVGLAGAAAAQPLPAETAAPAAARVSYDAAFYAAFAPRTALDMIEQTPGFAIVEGAARRGFSGALGNVLVDGEHPVAKSQTLADILGRIPAAQVVRIEILRGAETAGDPSGQTVLANVVRTQSAGQGAWSLGTEYAAQHQAAPNGWAFWSGRVGTTDYGLGLNTFSLLRELPGARELRDGAGDLLAAKQDLSPRYFYQWGLNGEAAHNLAGGRLRATGQAFYSRYHEDSSVLAFSPDTALLESEFNPYTETKRNLEAGLDYDRGLGAWQLSLAALATRKRFASEVTSTHASAAGAVDSVFHQDLLHDSGESIARATLTRAFAEGRRLELGAETAFNTLDASLALSLDLGDGPFGIPVPNSNLDVEESRGEAFLAWSQPVGPHWSLEARLAAEASRLSFSGDAEQSTRLAYLKPSLQLTRGFGAVNELRIRLYRDVAQLDFDDFVSAASISDDVIYGGNPDLRPETSWRAELGADFRFRPEAALGVTLFRHWLRDAQDLVPVGPPGGQIDAPGNIGDGEVSGATIALRAPLTPFIAGAAITLDATLQHAEVVDPLTHARRTITDFKQTELKAGFRQDLPAWALAWGLNYAGDSEFRRFRLDEVETRRESPSLDAFVETTALRPLKLRVSVLSLLDQEERRERVFYAPDRNGAITRVERSTRAPGRWLTLSVSGAF